MTKNQKIKLNYKKDIKVNIKIYITINRGK